MSGIYANLCEFEFLKVETEKEPKTKNEKRYFKFKKIYIHLSENCKRMWREKK